jgi:hypothetical protein
VEADRVRPGFRQSSFSVTAPGAMRKGGHRFLDAFIEAADIGSARSIQEQSSHERVMRTEPDGRRLGRAGLLRRRVCLARSVITAGSGR